MNLIVMPTRANTIRAFAAANPQLAPAEVARGLRAQLGPLLTSEVNKALGTGDRRRIKSVAK